MGLALAITLPILAYIILGGLAGSIAYKREYAKKYPETLDSWSFTDSETARKHAHHHSHEMAMFNAVPMAMFWPLIVPLFVLFMGFRWLVSTDVSKIQQSVETPQERRKREETLERAQRIIDDWEPPRT